MKKIALSENQKQTLSALNLSVEDLLNGRWEMNLESVIQEIQ